MHHHMQVTPLQRLQPNRTNSHHAAGVPTTPTTTTPTTQDPNNIRVNQHQHQSSTTNKQKHVPSPNQMQKIRQQHQHLNNNNNHSNSNTKCNQQQQPPPTQQQHQHQHHPQHPQMYQPRYDNRQNPHAHHRYEQQQQHPPQHIQYHQPPHQHPYGPPLQQAQLQNNYKHKPYGYGEPLKLKHNGHNRNFNGPKPLPGQRRMPPQHGSRHHAKNYDAAKKGSSLATIVEYSPPASSHDGSQINGSSEYDHTERQACGNNSATATTTAAADQLDNTPALPPNNTNCNANAPEQNHEGRILDQHDAPTSRHTKEKTAMCLVNELARFNKITHQYRLTGENGMAHCKTFTVTLKLGDEEYTAEGQKIKKAQHLAAAKALEETKYPHPPPKDRRVEEGSAPKPHVTPTVELNALAMKLGERTVYVLDPNQPAPPADVFVSPAEAYGAPGNVLTPITTLQAHMPYIRRNMPIMQMQPPQGNPPQHILLQQQRFVQRGYAPKYDMRYAMAPPMMGPRGPYMGPSQPRQLTPTRITLFVGKQKFIGNGLTLQQAKHDAAAQALQVLRQELANQHEQATDDNSEDGGDKKSPVSLIHEIGVKRNMSVHFKVLKEDGPPHMKIFVTACAVGDIVTEGEGNGKKISKKRAAEKMLAELEKLPPIVSLKQTPGKRGGGKGASPAKAAGLRTDKPERRKRTNLHATNKEKSFSDDKDNPVTRLIQLQQSRKENEPVFVIVAKNGDENSRRSEFVIEVSAHGITARGVGNNKKLAKRNAAINLLQMLEAQNASPQKANATEQPKQTNDNAELACTTPAETCQPNQVPNAEPHVAMVDTPVGLVPGILIQRQHKKHAAKRKELNGQLAAPVPDESVAPSTSTPERTVKASNETHATEDATTPSNSGAIDKRMKSELLYLAKLSGFEVDFSDYPKGNHKEFLSIVTLSTDPPQICHGVGSSAEASRNDAARNALNILRELGLRNSDSK